MIFLKKIKVPEIPVAGIFPELFSKYTSNSRTMKNQRFGQAAILDDSDYSKIRKNIIDQKYKILLDIAWYTGERWGAIVQTKVSDIYDENGNVRAEITFKACTRKALPNGQRVTRQVPIHTILKESLNAYKPQENSEYLFPGSSVKEHISYRWAEKIFKSAVEKAGLTNFIWSSTITNHLFHHQSTFISTRGINATDVLPT